jgi:hypothetical protein
VNRNALPVRLRPQVRTRAVHGLVLLLLLGFLVSANAASYIVKRGDTLYGIAKAYNIPLATLADRNGLSHNFHVYAGQRLILPSAGKGAASSRSSSDLPADVRRAIDKAPVQRGRWKYIVIHHSGVDSGTVAGMDRYHREVRHMENGIAYHFVIGNGDGMKDGSIAVCPRWTRQLDGGHLASEAQNHVAVGICLVGNFDKHKPSARQMKSLHALVEALMTRCRLASSAVKTHQQINIVHTRCPGAKFPTKTFIDSLD